MTCPGAALCTATSKSPNKAIDEKTEQDSNSREGEPERQADLRQMQGDPSAWTGHGDLL
jgi:hypothetical protein